MIDPRRFFWLVLGVSIIAAAWAFTIVYFGITV